MIFEDRCEDTDNNYYDFKVTNSSYSRNVRNSYSQIMDCSQTTTITITDSTTTTNDDSTTTNIPNDETTTTYYSTTGPATPRPSTSSGTY